MVNPLEARAEDRLAGGFVVKKRLGTGSTSVALLVQRDGQEGVLKVALDPSLNARVREEGQLLHTLRHQNIVELYDVVDIGSLHGAVHGRGRGGNEGRHVYAGTASAL